MQLTKELSQLLGLNSLCKCSYLHWKHTRVYKWKRSKNSAHTKNNLID